MSLADRLYRSAAKLAWLLAPVAAGGGGKIARGVRARRDAATRLTEWAGVDRDRSRPLVWLHAPSVGEGLQARAVLDALRARRPELQAVFTYFSPSAEALADRVRADFVGPLPWDVHREAGRAVTAVRPDVLAFTKSEVWPVLAAAARACGARTALIAASLPAASSRLRWPARAVARSTLAALDAVAAVGEADARRYRELGAPERAVQVVGDPGVDSADERVRAAEPTAPHLRPFRAPPAPTLVAGSTWPSDEEVLVPACTAARERAPGLRIVIAPHEPTLPAVRALEDRLRAAGWRVARLRAVEERGVVGDADAIVVDRVGPLAQLYTTADVAWVGGGFHGAGLHSVLEPAAAGAAIVFGPRHATVPAAGELVAAGAAREVSGKAAAARALADWLAEPAARASAGRAARRYIEDRLGGSERTAEIVSRLIPDRPVSAR